MSDSQFFGIILYRSLSGLFEIFSLICFVCVVLFLSIVKY